MKKFILGSMLFSFVVFQANAQTITFSPAKSVALDIQDPSFAEVEIKIALENSEDITFAWTRLENSFPAAWSYSLCDLGHCFVGIPDDGTMEPLTKTQQDNGDKAFFKISFIIDEGNFGEGTVKLYVYDSQNMNNGDTVQFDVSYKAPNGVKEVAKNPFVVYPNPSSGLVHFSSDQLTTYTYTLYDLQGKEILKGDQNNWISSPLNKGGYILLVEDKEGNIYREKILVN